MARRSGGCRPAYREDFHQAEARRRPTIRCLRGTYVLNSVRISGNQLLHLAALNQGPGTGVAGSTVIRVQTFEPKSAPSGLCICQKLL